MALIWVRGFEGEKSLARAWQSYWAAKRRAADRALTAAERGQAMLDSEAAEAAYEALVGEAETSLQADAAQGQCYTHALVVGVGRYDDTSIPALTTSIYGAQQFAEWLLTRFHHPDRPLGALEVIWSRPSAMAEWAPAAGTEGNAGVAERLGLEPGTALGLPPATFAETKTAFAHWLNRASANSENGAFFYFSGHGIWKSVPLLLPQDASAGASGGRFDNLIDIRQTLVNMFNVQPALQCFFVDACQEYNFDAFQNARESLGQPLWTPTNAPIIPTRDAVAYHGAMAGQRAFGRADGAPFFTQELISCLEKRAADYSTDNEQTWFVTTASLRRALEAAAPYRRETDADARNLSFEVRPDTATTTLDLCVIDGNPEAFVKVWCLPSPAMSKAKLYVRSNGTRVDRAQRSSDEWFTVVDRGPCDAGADFELPAEYQSLSQNFKPVVPVHQVCLKTKIMPPPGADATGPGGTS